jgi:hypothetical protein
MSLYISSAAAPSASFPPCSSSCCESGSCCSELASASGKCSAHSRMHVSSPAKYHILMLSVCQDLLPCRSHPNFKCSCNCDCKCNCNCNFCFFIYCKFNIPLFIYLFKFNAFFRRKKATLGLTHDRPKSKIKLVLPLSLVIIESRKTEFSGLALKPSCCLPR